MSPYRHFQKGLFFLGKYIKIIDVREELSFKLLGFRKLAAKQNIDGRGRIIVAQEPKPICAYFDFFIAPEKNCQVHSILRDRPVAEHLGFAFDYVTTQPRFDP
jgi:hypothetical protein